MEDLAYIYLTLHEDGDRHQRTTTTPSTTLPSAWAPANQGIHPLKVITATSHHPQSGSTVQEPDIDTNSPNYPSFYL